MDPLTKSLNTNYDQTLRAIDWQNQELYKQNKAIREAASQIGEVWKKFQETSLENEMETRVTPEEPRVVIETNTANTLQSMGSQSNPQLKLKIKKLANWEYVMNDVDITLEQNAFSVGDNLYEFSLDFINFPTNPNIIYEDISDEDEEKIRKIFEG